MITAIDDKFHHEGSDDPMWNESMWFGFSIPERNINAFVYAWHRPNMGLSCGGPALWDESGAHTYDCLFYDWNWMQATPRDAEATTFRLDNSFGIEAVEPLKTYDFVYDAHGCRLDLRWEAAIEPHTVGTDAEMTEAGKGHYEQHGRMTGTIELDGEVLKIDSGSCHDRSWGPRRLVNMPGGDFSWAVADDGSAFHVISFNDGPDNKVIGGYLFRDGVIGALVSGRRSVVRDSHARPLTAVVDAIDTLGRTLHAEAECTNCLDWHLYPDQFEWYCLAAWRFDGLLAYGDIQEFHPVREARQLIIDARGRK